MPSTSYTRSLERAGFIMGPPRAKGTVVWAENGITAVRELVRAFTALVGERREPELVEHGFLADADEYRSVFGEYANVHEVVPGALPHGNVLLRADNLVTTIAGLRATGGADPVVAVGGLLRRFDGRTPPLFRDRYIWPAVQLTERVSANDASGVLDFYRVAVERLLAAVGIACVTIRTNVVDDYGRITYLVVTAMPDGRPTVLATLYVLADGLRAALNEDEDVIDVGFTGKVIAMCAMVHSDVRGLLLPSVLAPVQVGVTSRPDCRPDGFSAWLASLAEAGLRVEVDTAGGTLSSRNRKEHQWCAAGVPLVVGVGRAHADDVVLAARGPHVRTPLPALPSAEELRAALDAHDHRLRAAGAALLARVIEENRHVRLVCADCAGTVVVFGELVPARSGVCERCLSQNARALFVSPEGRFY